jgi:hypothetical protein
VLSAKHLIFAPQSEPSASIGADRRAQNGSSHVHSHHRDDQAYPTQRCLDIHIVIHPSLLHPVAIALLKLRFQAMAFFLRHHSPGLGVLRDEHTEVLISAPCVETAISVNDKATNT